MLALVSGSVRAQERGVGDVVGVAGAASGVVGGDAQVVEALLRGDDGVFGIVNGEFVRQRGEVILDLGANDADGVVGTSVQALAHESGDVGRHVVVRVIGQVPRGVGVC